MPKHQGVQPLTLKKHFYIIAVSALLILLIIVAGNYPWFIERYYAGGAYIGISTTLHLALGWIPFSIGDLFYALVITLLIYAIVSICIALFKRNFSVALKVFLKTTIGVQWFVIAFYALWGLNYSRPAAAKILALPDSSFTNQQMINVTCALIDSANGHRKKLDPADLSINNSTIYDTAITAIRKAQKIYPHFKSYFPSVKPSLYTPFINYLATAGYFTPFTGEAQINYNMPIVNRPVSACHEMAHQMGFAREDEANFVGFLAGINSGDRLLRYSAYYLAMEEFMQQLRRRDSVTFNEVKLQLSPTVKTDLKADNAYWQHYRNEIGKISSVFYDNFLKANKQPEGLLTYNRMVLLTMGYYHQQKPIIRRHK